jgi:two-component system response regulator DevR
MASPPLRLLLVDDSEVVRLGLTALLGQAADLSIVAQAGTVKEAIAAATASRPDVVLLDIRLPDGTGFDACRGILAAHPAARVLVLTSVADESVVDDAIRAGAHGYLLKEVNGQALLAAIRAVAAGQSILDPAITERVLHLMRSRRPAERNVLDTLSPQEAKVLAGIAEGLANKEVAARLGLAEKTVRNYLATIFEKLHVNRRTQAAALYARGRGPSGGG